MAKIVLFFPIVEEGQRNLLPLSLLLVAASLVEAKYDVKIIDQRVDPDWKNSVLKELKSVPLFFGVSVLTGNQILHGLEVSQLVKENSDALVVWGGVHPSLMPNETLENKFIDLVVIGEGEKTLLELANRLNNHQDYSDVLGVGYKKNNQIVVNQPREFINLNDQPKIPYHLIDVEKYISCESSTVSRSTRDLSTYTSRGCPHRCAFCYNEGFNKRKWRGQTAQRAFDDMKKLIDDYKLNSFSIQDDEFFTNFERVKKFCQLIIENNLDLEFVSSCRVDYICRMDEDFLQLIRKAGFKTLELGIETGSPRISEMIKKDVTNEQVLDAVAKLKQSGIIGKYCFMSGFPNETISDMFQTTDLMRKIKMIDLNSRIPCWRIFTPFPGIELYNTAVENGWQPPQDLSEWASYDFQTVKMPWVNKKMERIINNVAYLVKFLRLQDKNLSIWHRLWGRWVDFRWRHHWFYFLPEKEILESIINIRKRCRKN
jgi:anaerobic magnesium-protoporphyrin IX monomethyl ester cyclase